VYNNEALRPRGASLQWSSPEIAGMPFGPPRSFLATLPGEAAEIVALDSRGRACIMRGVEGL